MLPATLREAARTLRRLAPRTSPPAGWPLSYTALDRISDEVAGGSRTPRRPTRATSSRSCSRPAPSTSCAISRRAKLGAITAGVNDRLTARERDAVVERAAPALVVAAPGLAPSSHDAIEVDPRPTRTRSSSICASPAHRPRRLRRRPRPARGHHLHVGHDRHAEGRAVLQPPARVHHPHRRRRRAGVAARRAARSRRSRISAS